MSSKVKTILSTVIWAIIAFIIGLSMMYIALVSYIKSNPVAYILAGNTLEGTVVGRDRMNGFSLVIDTEAFDEIYIACTAEEYKSTENGTKISVSAELCIEEAN